jgi:hypothetical protein
MKFSLARIRRLQCNVRFLPKAGTVTEVVTVSGQTVLAVTPDFTIGTVVDAKQVAQLPLNGRQFTQLTLLALGASTQSSGPQAFFEVKSDYAAISPAVSGARAVMNKRLSTYISGSCPGTMRRRRPLKRGVPIKTSGDKAILHFVEADGKIRPGHNVREWRTRS